VTPPPETPARTDSFRPVLGATVLLVLALLAIASLKSSRDLEAARARERLLQERIAETRARSERLRVRIDRLRHDPGMLERLAREDLGMARPGDVIIELPKAVPPRRPVRAAAPSPHPPAPSPSPSLPASPGEGEAAPETVPAGGPHLPGPPLPQGEEGEKQLTPPTPLPAPLSSPPSSSLPAPG
jgi:cell division protein FtsB